MREYQKFNFKKSSFSNNYGKCVGVAKNSEKILVTNTKQKEDIVEFTTEEWDAFLKGVKAGEFDDFI